MRVVVAGGGYAGTYAANRLAREMRTAEITVLNPRPFFVERVRLHQQLAGTASAARPLTAMLHDRVTARVGTVDKIGAGGITLADGENIDFDYAVLAVGSTVRPLPGTVPVGTWEGAERARAALAACPAGGTVTVIGGGPTGVETAAEVAAARPDLRVRLIGAPVGGGFTGPARDRVRAGLTRLNVEIVDGVADDLPPADLTLWAIVSGVPDLAARSGLPVDADGRVLVDEFLRSTGDDRIFAVGDCAAVPGARFACQTAIPQAAHAAGNLARLAAGREPRPFATRYYGLAVSLGRDDAVLQVRHRDDTPRPARLAGRSAAVLKEAGLRGVRLGTRLGRGA